MNLLKSLFCILLITTCYPLTYETYLHQNRYPSQSWKPTKDLNKFNSWSDYITNKGYCMTLPATNPIESYKSQYPNNFKQIESFTDLEVSFTLEFTGSGGWTNNLFEMYINGIKVYKVISSAEYTQNEPTSLKVAFAKQTTQNIYLTITGSEFRLCNLKIRSTSRCQDEFCYPNVYEFPQTSFQTQDQKLAGWKDSSQGDADKISCQSTNIITPKTTTQSQLSRTLTFKHPINRFGLSLDFYQLDDWAGGETFEIEIKDQHNQVTQLIKWVSDGDGEREYLCKNEKYKDAKIPLSVVYELPQFTTSVEIIFKTDLTKPTAEASFGVSNLNVYGYREMKYQQLVKELFNHCDWGWSTLTSKRQCTTCQDGLFSCVELSTTRNDKRYYKTMFFKKSYTDFLISFDVETSANVNSNLELYLNGILVYKREVDYATHSSVSTKHIQMAEGDDTISLYAYGEGFRLFKLIIEGANRCEQPNCPSSVFYNSITPLVQGSQSITGWKDAKNNNAAYTSTVTCGSVTSLGQIHSQQLVMREFQLGKVYKKIGVSISLTLVDPPDFARFFVRINNQIFKIQGSYLKTPTSHCGGSLRDEFIKLSPIIDNPFEIQTLTISIQTDINTNLGLSEVKIYGIEDYPEFITLPRQICPSGLKYDFKLGICLANCGGNIKYPSNGICLECKGTNQVYSPRLQECIEFESIHGSIDSNGQESICTDVNNDHYNPETKSCTGQTDFYSLEHQVKYNSGWVTFLGQQPSFVDCGTEYLCMESKDWNENNNNIRKDFYLVNYVQSVKLSFKAGYIVDGPETYSVRINGIVKEFSVTQSKDSLQDFEFTTDIFKSTKYLQIVFNGKDVAVYVTKIEVQRKCASDLCATAFSGIGFLKQTLIGDDYDAYDIEGTGTTMSQLIYCPHKMLGRLEGKSKVYSKTYSLPNPAKNVAIVVLVTKIDSWDLEDLHILIDDTIQSKYNLAHYETDHDKANFCRKAYGETNHEISIIHKFSSSKSTVKIGFSGIANEDINNESFGIYNLRIYSLAD